MFITETGGLTAAGYCLFILIGLAVFAAGTALAGKRSAGKRFSAKKTVFCAAALALSFVTSCIQLLRLPFGGEVTLFSMLFIVLIANWYGPATGILTGFAYGVLRFLQDPYFLSVPQVCLDYFFAFAALGTAGFFMNRKHGLIRGYLAGVLARGVFASLAGYVFWMDYMPENFPKSIALLYPVIYNYGYLLAEALITVILLSVPSVNRAFARVRMIAREEQEPSSQRPQPGRA